MEKMEVRSVAELVRLCEVASIEPNPLGAKHADRSGR
jgi:hypothetical protein